MPFKRLGERWKYLGNPLGKVLGGGVVSPPAQPTGLTATPVSTSQIDLAWTDNATDETGYRVYRSTDGSVYSQVGVDLAADANSYSDTTITSGTYYYYKVAAVNAGGETLSDAATANTLTYGLSAYYKLDETSGNRADSSGNGKTLTDVNTVTSDTGIIGNAAKFTAANDERLTASGIAFGDVDWEITGWLNITASGIQMICSKWSVGVAQIFQLYSNSTSLTLYVGDGSTGAISNQTLPGVITTGEWLFYDIYHDSVNNKIGIAVNGGVFTTPATSGPSGDAAIDFIIGGRVNGDLDNNGKVDEVGVWVGRLLTANERAARYSGGAGNTHPFLDGLAYGYSQVDTVVSGQNAMILVPETNLNGAAVIYHHGLGEDETGLNGATKTSIVREMIGAGYILCGSNAHGENFGNNDSLTDYENLRAYMVANYGVSKVVILSQSMGGLSGLLTFANNPTLYDGWVGIFPLCDLAYSYAHSGTWETYINTAYDIPGGGDYATQTAGHDPVLLSATPFTGKRMRFYASASDTVADKAANSDAMQTLVGGVATESDVVVCSGEHGDPSHFQPVDLVAFLDRCIA